MIAHPRRFETSPTQTARPASVRRAEKFEQPTGDAPAEMLDSAVLQAGENTLQGSRRGAVEAARRCGTAVECERATLRNSRRAYGHRRERSRHTQDHKGEGEVGHVAFVLNQLRSESRDHISGYFAPGI